MNTPVQAPLFEEYRLEKHVDGDGDGDDGVDRLYRGCYVRRLLLSRRE